VPGGKFVYNIGFFKDTRSQDESFNKNDKQTVVRGVWLPLAGTDRGVLHIALQARHALADDGFLQYRSKPESFQAQSYAIDTGEFAADHANTYGVETYYRPGPLMFGMEYVVNKVKAPESGDPFFHGGEVLAAYLLTGETRPYNGRGGYFERVSPARPLFGGGYGALGTDHAVLVRRHGQRADPRRPVLARHADGQLAHDRQCQARAHLRIWVARSFRHDRQDTFLPESHPVSTVTVASGSPRRRLLGGVR
jgi:hypothetical protein